MFTGKVMLNFIGFSRRSLIRSTIFILSSVPLLAQVATRHTYRAAEREAGTSGLNFGMRTYITAATESGRDRLMVQIGITNAQLQFLKHDKDSFRADVKVTIVIKDTTGAEVQTDDWLETFFALAFKDTESSQILDMTQETYEIAPGNYELSVHLEDMETQKSGEQQLRFTAPNFQADSLMLSDIVFMNSVSFPTSDLDKPREANSDNQLYAYFEIYNVPEGDSVQLDFKLLGYKGRTGGTKRYVGQGSTVKDYIPIERDSVVVGNLGIEMTLRSRTQNLFRSQFLDLRERKPNKIFNNLAESIEMLDYIADRKIIKYLQELEGEEQLKAFHKFWEERDPSAKTAVNELMTIYYSRIEHANREFGDSRAGWKTQMGMVFVKLGAPDYYYQANADAYQIYTMHPNISWYYSRFNRRVIFEYRGGEYRISNYPEVFDLLAGKKIYLQ